MELDQDGRAVIITPGQITPASFSHPLLVAQKVVPQPLIANDPATDAPAVKSDKGADAGSATKPANSSLANSEASLDLRPTVGHAAPLREQTHTADASSALPAINAVVTMSDAAPSAAKVQPASDTPNAEAKAGAPKSEPAAKPRHLTSNRPRPPLCNGRQESRGGRGHRAVQRGESRSQPGNEIRRSERRGSHGSDHQGRGNQVQVPEAKPAEAKPTESKAAEKPAEPVKSVADAPAAPAVAPDVKKDAARLPGAEKAAKAEPPRRPGQIAVFVSRKDSKLYVRENFKPQFDVPITIAPSDRPLGTHVFTAEADKNDPNLLRWSVVSLPVTARNAARTDEDDRAARRRKVAGGA